jgi:hypothetical protein
LKGVIAVGEKDQAGQEIKALAKKVRNALDEAMQQDPVQHIREAFQQRLEETGQNVRQQELQPSNTAVQDNTEQRRLNRKPWWSRLFRW